MSGEHSLTQDPSQIGQGIATRYLGDVGVRVAPGYEAPEDVLAVRRRLKAIQVGGIWNVDSDTPAGEGDVVADKGVRAYPNVVNPHQLDHIVVLVKNAVDVLGRVVAQGVGHGGDSDEATFPGAGQELPAPCRQREIPIHRGKVRVAVLACAPGLLDESLHDSPH